MKALRKSALVEAFKYDGDLKGSDGKYYTPDWIIKPFRQQLIKIREETGELVIYAKDRYLTAKVGDYVIKDSDGDIYPCSAYMFEKMYMSVDETLPEVEKMRELCKPVFMYLCETDNSNYSIQITNHWISVFDSREILKKMLTKRMRTFEIE